MTSLCGGKSSLGEGRLRPRSNEYSRFARTPTGLPSLMAGLNLIFLVASIAFSFSPSGNPRTTLIEATVPSTAKITFKRRSSVYRLQQLAS